MEIQAGARGTLHLQSDQSLSLHVAMMMHSEADNRSEISDCDDVDGAASAEMVQAEELPRSDQQPLPSPMIMRFSDDFERQDHVDDCQDQGHVCLGPTTPAGAFNWASSFWHALEVRGLHFVGEDLSRSLRSKFSAGVSLSTEYSGMGGAEYGWHEIIGEGQQRFSCKWPVAGCLLKAGDCAPHCRAMLLAGIHDMKPCCIFGDILERTPRALLDQARELSKQYAASATEMIASGAARQKAFRIAGQAFLKEVVSSSN